MHLMCIGVQGAEKPVVRLDDEHYVDVSDLAEDFDEAFFGGGLDRNRPVVAEGAASGLVSRFAGERVGAPIARPHQILCTGLNYRDHAAETGQAVPDEPILFTKSLNTLIGPDDDVRIPWPLLFIRRLLPWRRRASSAHPNRSVSSRTFAFFAARRPP